VESLALEDWLKAKTSAILDTVVDFIAANPTVCIVTVIIIVCVAWWIDSFKSCLVKRKEKRFIDSFRM